MDTLQVRKDLLIKSSDLKLIKHIGEGSYGEIWKGAMGTVDVAVKKMLLGLVTPQFLRTIEKEIELLASLHHPNVLQIYGVCVVSSNEYWIVMEFAEGGSLYSQLSAHEVDIPWTKRWKWIKDVAESVAFLHKRGVIHRDLKSPNFLLLKDTVKVCDFGMATKASTSSSFVTSSAIKSAGSIGTVRWLAPECTAKTPVYNAKTDVYGMGMVIWEIASRDIPFKDVPDNAQVICLVKYEQERPDIPAGCPHTIQKVIQKCWEHDPALRPTSVEVATQIHHEILKLGNASAESSTLAIPEASLEGEGILLLKTICKGKFAADTYVFHTNISKSCAVILTEVRLIRLDAGTFSYELKYANMVSINLAKAGITVNIEPAQVLKMFKAATKVSLFAIEDTNNAMLVYTKLSACVNADRIFRGEKK